jgi:hypothetical protein
MISLISLLTHPMRLAERLRYGWAVKRTVIEQDPVFIVGHWRSGTTWLHNLMSSDPKFGYVSCIQMAAPEAFLIGGRIFRAVLNRIKPTRPMDNVPMAPDSPQEDEFVMAQVSQHSAYHFWSFPRRMLHYFRRYALLQGLSPEAISEWEADYLRVLKKTTLSVGGKRLVLKNPVNMGRIPNLLKLFPNAKFIHVCRDPYVVFASTRRLHSKTLPLFQLQSVDAAEVESNILVMYRELMSKFLADRALIPQGNLVEVRFEDLERAPLDALRSIYTALDLPELSRAEQAFRSYIDEHTRYQKNAYVIDQDIVRTVDQHWGFALSALHYGGR